MALVGQAALAMWWDMAPALRPEFEHWHTHEHLPERLAIPGFRRASRWSCAEDGEGFFVLYELADHSVLSSPAYLARLNAPTPWSKRMMPHHRQMVRCQCLVLESRGGIAARQLLTLRLSPQAGREHALRSALAAKANAWVGEPGVAGVHLLRHEAPPLLATEEQRIRGLADRAADWILLAAAYDVSVLRTLAEGDFGDAALQDLGAAPGIVRSVHALSACLVAADCL